MAMSTIAIWEASLDHSPTAEAIRAIRERRQCGVGEAKEIAQGEAIIMAALKAKSLEDLSDLIVRIAADFYRINRL